MPPVPLVLWWDDRWLYQFVQGLVGWQQRLVEEQQRLVEEQREDEQGAFVEIQWREVLVDQSEDGELQL